MSVVPAGSTVAAGSLLFGPGLSGQICRVIADLATSLADVPPADVGEAINRGIDRLATAANVDACALYRVVDTQTMLCSIHQWVRAGGAALPTEVDISTALPELLLRMKAGPHSWISNAGDIGDPIHRESLGSFGKRSCIAFPVTFNTNVQGLLLFSVAPEKRWGAEEIDGFRLATAVIGQGLARQEETAKMDRTMTETRKSREQLAGDNLVLRREVTSHKARPLVVGESSVIKSILAQVDQVASTTASVLLLGETGSGKEVFAQYIHDMSPRRHRPMVRVSCAAIPTALIESELFGRERGAYTGALSRQVGRFELANGSTILLDEIGELSPEIQVKLLRVLQDHVIERLGSVQPIKVDVRIIAATNANLEKAVAENRFREDLYYRLNVFPITIPPLRERREDIAELAWTFIDEFSKAYGKTVTSMSRESLAALQRYSWPGNVRELRNLIEREMIVSKGSNLVISPPRQAGPLQRSGTTLRDIETDHIRSILVASGWRVRGNGGAAERLGMKPTTLESRMAKLGIVRDRSCAQEATA